MKKFLSTMISIALASSLSQAQNIDVIDDWKLVGAVEDIDVSNFDNSCVKTVWTYDGEWKLYLNPSFEISSDKFSKISSISEGNGFWIKGQDPCTLDTNVKTLSAINQAINIIETLDIEQDNVDTKLEEAKEKVEGLTSSDAIMVQSILEIADIFNSNEVSNIINIDGTNITETTNFGKLVKSTVLDTIKVSDNFNNVSDNTRTIMNNLATKLKTISDNIMDVYTDTTYVYEYGNEKISYDDSIAIRSSILALAFKLDFVASYSWGDDEDVKINTETIQSVSYEYRNIDVYPATVLNKGKVFKLDDTNRFDGAREYLVEALKLAVTLPIGYDEMSSEDKVEAEKILDSIENGTSYIDNDEWTDWDGNKMVTESEIIHLNLKNFFTSSTAIDISDLGSGFTSVCTENGFVLDSEKSKMENQVMCLSGSNYSDHTEIQISVLPTASTSNIDDVIVKWVDNGTEYTGQGLIDYLFDDEE